MFLAFRELEAFLLDTWHCSQEGGDIAHADRLQRDANGQAALTANDVHEKQGTRDAGHKLDDTENCGCEELLILAFSAEEGKLGLRQNLHYSQGRDRNIPCRVRRS